MAEFVRLGFLPDQEIASRISRTAIGKRKRSKQTTWACFECDVPLCHSSWCWQRHHGEIEASSYHSKFQKSSNSSYLCCAIFTVVAKCKHQFTTGHFNIDRHLQARKTDSSANYSTSSSSPFPACTSATACSNSCTVGVANPYYFYWTPYSITGTVVASTVIEIVDTLDDATRTTNVFADLPTDYLLPPTDVGGTYAEVIAYTRSSVGVTTVLWVQPTSSCCLD